MDNQAERYPFSIEAASLAEMKKVHDRLHLRNHHVTCREGELDPDFYPELKGVNTEVAEQYFSHLLKFTKLFKNTTPARAKV